MRNTKIYKIGKLRRRIYFVFYNTSPPNLVILLILGYSFQLWYTILLSFARWRLSLKWEWPYYGRQVYIFIPCLFLQAISQISIMFNAMKVTCMYMINDISIYRNFIIYPINIFLLLGILEWDTKQSSQAQVYAPMYIFILD